jgi:fatty-acid peroxygenase
MDRVVLHEAHLPLCGAVCDGRLALFPDEVETRAPFIPFVGDRILAPFTWHDHRFDTGDWVLIDLYGTNHDPWIWSDPNSFRPERFCGRAIDPYTSCPTMAATGVRRIAARGWVTVEQVKAVTRLLLREMRYEVPKQEFAIDLARIPAAPGSRFVHERSPVRLTRMLDHIERRHPAAAG